MPDNEGERDGEKEDSKEMVFSEICPPLSIMDN
jgi:hypothetical protein